MAGTWHLLRACNRFRRSTNLRRAERQRFDQFSAAVSIILLQWEAELSILSPEMDIKIWCPCMRGLRIA